MSATTSATSSTYSVAAPAFGSRASGVYRFGHESNDDGGAWRVDWLLKRNCSLAPRQLLGFYLGLCALSLGIASLFWWHGARMVMPFAWLELALVGVCMLVYARHAGDHERISLGHGWVTVSHASGSRLTQVDFQPDWVKVEPQNADSSLIELSGQGRRIAVGRFVRPELRGLLAGELRRAVRRAQAH